MRSLLPLLAAMLSIQIGASVAKQIFPVAGPIGMTTLRLGFAAFILAIVVKPWRGGLNKQQISRILPYGIALGCMNITFYLALERIPLGLTVALEFTGPLAAAIFTSRRALDFLWAILAGLGIVLIMPVLSQHDAPDALGAFMALVAGAFWALYIVFGKKVSQSLPSARAASLGMLTAAAAVVPFGIAHEGPRLLSASILPAALLVSILSSALPYSLEMYALKSLPTRTFAILMSLEPAVAVLVGALFLGEALSMRQTVAIACIMAASAGTALYNRQK